MSQFVHEHNRLNITKEEPRKKVHMLNTSSGRIILHIIGLLQRKKNFIHDKLEKFRFIH